MPAQSEQQRKAAGATLSAKRKGSSKNLGGASQSMYESMTEEELADFASKEAASSGVLPLESLPDVLRVLKSIDRYIKGRG